MSSRLNEFGERGDEKRRRVPALPPRRRPDRRQSRTQRGHVRGFPSNTSNITIDGGDIVGAGAAPRAPSRSSRCRRRTSRAWKSPRCRLRTCRPPVSAAPINLINKSGFDAKKPVFSYQVYQLFHKLEWLHVRWRAARPCPGHQPENHPTIGQLQLPVPGEQELRVHGRRYPHVAAKTWRAREKSLTRPPRGTWSN